MSEAHTQQTSYKPLSRNDIAYLVAHDFPDGAVVNLGIGMPTLVADFLPKDREILLQSENGILGMGGAASGADIDLDIINASRTPVVLLPGASITEHTIAFAMMRGGHLDYSVLGGFQVAENGDLANWLTSGPGAIAAIGGAMDLAVGAREVIVMMEHVTKEQTPKLLPACTYPLTAAGVVNYVYTDLAIIDITPKGFVVRAILEGLTVETLAKKTGAALAISDKLAVIRRNAQGNPVYK
ncbi:MAG: 3-oxoacid CoA-transferase subunit B [Alcaligenaceae bacterium]